MKLIKSISKYGFLKSFQIMINMFRKEYNMWVLKLNLKRDRFLESQLISGDLNILNELILLQKDLGLVSNVRSIVDNKLYTDESLVILKEADNYCTNNFNILGSGWISWESNGSIDWHTDKINDWTWEHDLYFTDISKKIRSNIISHSSDISDPKIPRELSRFHFLFSLFYAYIYTGQQKYLEKIKSSILDWISNNPPFFGLNWSNAMEAAIRISNWCLVVNALKHVLLTDIEFTGKFYRALAEHLSYIENNPENIIVKNNHYISNIVGILVIHSLFPIFKKNKECLRTAARKLRQELKSQIYEDGGDTEGSTVYHRLVTELFLYPFYLSEKLGLNLFNRQDSVRLHNMFLFIKYVIKPNGNIIQFGDNDSGRLIKLFERPALSQDYMLSLGFGLFKDNDFCIKEFQFDILGYVLWGDEVKKQYDSETYSIVQLSSKAFKTSGIYILRNDKFFAAISAIPIGNGVHTHNDKLSFELAYKELDVIVDPGTYIYSSDVDMRNKFRSTSSHNTVIENGYEQNEFGLNVFELANDSRMTIKKFDSNTFEAYHDGFIIKGGHRHSRSFQLNDESIIIKDNIDSDEPLRAFLHFGPGIKINEKNSKFFIHANDYPLLSLIFDEAIDTTIESYDYSPGYGELIKCRKLSISFKKQLQTRFILN